MTLEFIVVTATGSRLNTEKLSAEQLCLRFASEESVLRFAQDALPGDVLSDDERLIVASVLCEPVDETAPGGKLHPWTPTEEDWQRWSEWARIHRTC